MTEPTDRAREIPENYSRQPRFEPEQNPSLADFFTSVFHLTGNEDPEPPYLPSSRPRDGWLRKFWRKEPHMAGVLDGIVNIHKNRAWSLTGGRNQVIRFTDVLHNWESAPGLIGWRAGLASAATAYLTSDLGCVVELGTDGSGGPLRGLYHVDPARCALSGDPEKPLFYYPPRGKMQKWSYGEFLRITSMPSTDEAYRGLGFCGLSRALELAKTMIAVQTYDQEQLGAKAPRGLLLLKGIDERQWTQAMEGRKAIQAGDMYQYFASVAVLANGMQEIDAKLIALSQLPSNYNQKEFIDLYMYGLAVCFGFDPSEFWPVQFGSIGRGNETEVQARKASAKGGADFSRAFQEQLQDALPDTLQYEFDERDEAGDIAHANLAAIWAKTASELYKAGTGVLDLQESRALLAENNVIPRHWTEYQEDSEATDVEDVEDIEDDGMKADLDGPEEDTPDATPEAERKRLRTRSRDLPAVQRAARRFPSEPILRYTWPAGRYEVLWSRADEAARRASFPAAKAKQRAGDVLYEGADFTITTEDVRIAIEEGGRRVGQTFRECLEQPPIETDEETTNGSGE